MAIAKEFTFLRAGLRRLWMRHPNRTEFLKSIRKTVTGKRHKYEVQCVHCKDWFKQNEVQLDHIEPCGTMKDKETALKFYERLFWGELQVLCKPCHKVKTKEERRKG